MADSSSISVSTQGAEDIVRPNATTAGFHSREEVTAGKGGLPGVGGFQSAGPAIARPMAVPDPAGTGLRAHSISGRRSRDRAPVNRSVGPFRASCTEVAPVVLGFEGSLLGFSCCGPLPIRKGWILRRRGTSWTPLGPATSGPPPAFSAPQIRLCFDTSAITLQTSQKTCWQRRGWRQRSTSLRFKATLTTSGPGSLQWHVVELPITIDDGTVALPCGSGPEDPPARS